MPPRWSFQSRTGYPKRATAQVLLLQWKHFHGSQLPPKEKGKIFSFILKLQLSTMRIAAWTARLYITPGKVPISCAQSGMGCMSLEIAHFAIFLDRTIGNKERIIFLSLYVGFLACKSRACTRIPHIDQGLVNIHLAKPNADTVVTCEFGEKVVPRKLHYRIAQRCFLYILSRLCSTKVVNELHALPLYQTYDVLFESVNDIRQVCLRSAWG